MSITPQTQALLLLTGRFGDRAGAMPASRPLDDAQWTQLAAWLKKRGLQPGDLLAEGASMHLAAWDDLALPASRIIALLEHRAVLAHSIERWDAAGIWAIGRADPDYPKRLKRRLRGDAPPVLFGHGDRASLNRGGLALLIGEDAATATRDFARRLAAQVSRPLSAIVGAGELDNPVLRDGLAPGGYLVVVLRGGLLRTVTRGTERHGGTVDGDRLLLVSAAAPDRAVDEVAGAEAVAERCLYGLSDAAILLGRRREGDRAAGLAEALEHAWVPIWVAGTDHEARRLLRLGAHPWPGAETPLRMLLTPPHPAPGPHPGHTLRPDDGDSFAGLPPIANPGPVLVQAAGFAEQLPALKAPEGGQARARLSLVPPAAARSAPAQVSPSAAGAALFDAFVAQLTPLLGRRPLTPEAIAEALELAPAQVELWLQRAERAGFVHRDTANRLYQVRHPGRS